MNPRIAALADRLAPIAAARLHPSSPVARLLRPVANRLLGQGFTKVSVASGPAKGVKLIVDSATEKFIWTGHHEHHVLEAVRRNLHPGDCFWDVGAHIGYVACFAGLCVGPTGHVVAFEPMPETRGRLDAGAAANGLQNLESVAAAISTRVGTQQLFAGTSSVSWSLDEEWKPLGALDEDRTSIEVECTTLDLAAGRHPVPSLIKVDAEAAELDVLRSGGQLIRRHRPILLVEFTAPELVEAARGEYPDYRFELLGENHWLMTPDTDSTPPPQVERSA